MAKICSGFETTYKELKPMEENKATKKVASFETTYKELKPARPHLPSFATGF